MEWSSLFSLDHALSMDQPFGTVLLTCFLAGIVVSFTPCIYPMIPITASVIQAQGSRSVIYSFLLSVSYVLGLASVYATLGYAVASTSLIFGEWFSHPWFIGLVVVFFLYFAFAMFGFYEIYIPAFLRSRKTVGGKGSLGSSFVLGALAGTVTSPCITPALALMLGYVAQLSNPILGFLALFSFSLGMGMLLIIVGTFSGAMAFLPQAGAWMMEVKKVFGFLLLGVCIYLLQPLMEEHYAMGMYGLLMLTGACYYWLSSRRLVQ